MKYLPRLDYQPLFGKMSPHSSPRRSGWTRAISFVGFSQSCYRLQIFVWQGLSHKLSDQNKVVKMADDVDKMNVAFERVLECFKLQNLKDSQREALQNLVKGGCVFCCFHAKELKGCSNDTCIQHQIRKSLTWSRYLLGITDHIVPVYKVSESKQRSLVRC